MALGINFAGRSNVGPVTINLGDVTVAGEMITANGTPVCVKYLDPDGDVQFDAVLMVTSYDPDDVTAQPNPVGLFEIQTGNVLVAYNLPGGITEVEWSFGDCAAFLAEYLNEISVDIGAIATAIANIEADISAIATSTATASALLSSILSVLNDIEVNTAATATAVATLNATLENTGLLTQYFCDQYEGGTQRFITIYILNNDTGAIVSQSNWYNNPANNNALEPYTIQGTVGGVDCCPPDSCPPIIGSQIICLQTVNPCDTESFTVVFGGDPDAGYTASIEAGPGVNSPYTVAWSTTGDIVLPGATTGNTVDIEFNGAGSLIVEITVSAPDGECVVNQEIPFGCDAEAVIVPVTSNYVFGSYIRLDGADIPATVVSLEIGGVTYLAADYATVTGNPVPTTDDPINLLDFLGWVSQQHPTGTDFSLDSLDPGSLTNRINILSCANEESTLIVDAGAGNYDIDSEFDGFFTETDLVCGGALCLTAELNPISPPDGYSLAGFQVNSWQWTLSEGLTAVEGETLDGPTVCVIGCGTVQVDIESEICGTFSTTLNICSPCAGGTVEIAEVTGSEVCAGIEVTDIDIDEVNRKIVFSFNANDTNTGVSVINAGYTQILPGNILNPLYHPLDPNYQSVLNIVGNSGTITIPYPHYALQSGAPIQNGGEFVRMEFGIIPGGYTILETPGSPIVWNSGSDPFGSTFNAAVQAFLNTIEATYNLEMHSAVYVQGGHLHLIVRVYTGAGVLATVNLAKLVYKSTSVTANTEITNSVITTGVPFIRLLATDCGNIVTGLRVSQLSTWWIAIPANVNTFVNPFTPLPSWGIWSTYPQCCGTQTTLTASLPGATITSYFWSFSGSLSLTGGSPTSATVQVEGSGVATVIIHTVECGNVVQSIIV